MYPYSTTGLPLFNLSGKFVVGGIVFDIHELHKRVAGRALGTGHGYSLSIDGHRSALAAFVITTASPGDLKLVLAVQFCRNLGDGSFATAGWSLLCRLKAIFIEARIAAIEGDH